MRYQAIITAAVAAAAGLTLAACSAGTKAASPAASASAAASNPSSGRKASAAAMTAGQVVAALRSHGLPVTLTKVFTAVSDPNHLIGRPGQYTSKAEFTDSRVKQRDATSHVAPGSSTEVFTSNADAMRRATYIESVTQAAPMLGTEYDYVARDVLVRVSGQLIPAQARAYKAALQAIEGTPVVEPSPVST